MNPYRLILLAGALLLIEALIGGTRLVFALPAYFIVGAMGLTAVFGKRDGITQPRWYCIASALLLFAWVVFRACTSPVAYLAWPDLYMVMACLVVYASFAWFFTGTRERLWVFLFLLVLAMVQVGIGIRQFRFGDDWMLLNLARTPYGRRASGLYVHPIHLAGYLEAIGAVALSLACWARWRLEARLATGFAALLCYLGVAISGSRGGYISVATSVIVFFLLSLWMLFRVDRHRFLVTLVVGMVLLIASGSLATTLMSRSIFLRGRLSMMNDQFSGKWDVRIYNWQAALDQFRVSPVVGTGSGTHLYFGRIFRRPQIQSDPVHAHSDYLELLAEYGLVGGGVMLLFLLAHLASGLIGTSRILRRDVLDFGEARGDNLALHLGLLSAVAAYLAHSAVDFNMHIPGNALLFAIIFGCQAQPRAGTVPTSGWALPALLPRLGLPILSAWAVGIALWRFPGEYWAEEARKALRDGELQKCVTLVEKCLRYERYNPEAFFYQGEAFRTMAKLHSFRALRREPFERAVAAYDQALRLFPQDENYWVRRGQALDGLTRYPEAETCYLTAIQLDPNLGVLYAYYATHLRRRGRELAADEMLGHTRRLTGVNLSRILYDPHDVQGLRPPDPKDQ